MMAISPEEQHRLDELRDKERFWLGFAAACTGLLILAVAALLTWGTP
jgi:hypothetical protein